jgi:hypothetical protein
MNMTINQINSSQIKKCIQGDYKFCERLHILLARSNNHREIKLNHYASVQQSVLSCSLEWSAFNFCVLITSAPLVQSGKTASGGCSAGQGSSEL